MNTTRNRSSIFSRIKQKFLFLLRITNRPVVKVYNGYGTTSHVTVFGHVFTLSPLPRKRYRRNIWTNTLALIRLFIVRTESRAKLQWVTPDHQVLEKDVEQDGFYKFDWHPSGNIEPGWHHVKVRLIQIRDKKPKRECVGEGWFFIPHVNQYSFISDIDDTFLISHSSNLRKRLFVLLTENARSRKPFEGVVYHYRLLTTAGVRDGEFNPFFYVSSSEWNLYDYILEFSRINELPRGIYLLNQMKVFKEIWKTGQNNHGTKFMRITRILEAYPEQRFILLGDDSQQDPVIYASIVEHFPEQIKAVYLRNVFDKNAGIAEDAIRKIEAHGIECCHFEHSQDAIAHSISIGLIEPELSVDADTID